jgi:ribonuclease E
MSVIEAAVVETQPAQAPAQVAPEPAVEAEDPSKPKRKGWWSLGR